MHKSSFSNAHTDFMEREVKKRSATEECTEWQEKRIVNSAAPWGDRIREKAGGDREGLKEKRHRKKDSNDLGRGK